MPYVAPDLATLNLSEIADLVAARKLPPVEQWDPPHIGESEMRITANGTWYHQGSEIRRPAMVRAFSSLLRHDSEGKHWLVTPQQKLSIDVEDAPFVVVELHSEGAFEHRRLAFRLNSDDLVMSGPDSAIEFRNGLPYLHVRYGLWAKIARSVYYELAEIALSESPEEPKIWSDGVAFAIGAAE
jgi:uncharacterized protein